MWVIQLSLRCALCWMIDDYSTCIPRKTCWECTPAFSTLKGLRSEGYLIDEDEPMLLSDFLRKFYVDVLDRVKLTFLSEGLTGLCGPASDCP